MLSFRAANHTTYARRLHVNTETVSSHMAQWGLFRIVPQRMKRKSSAVLAWKRLRREQKRRSFLFHKGCCCSCRWGEAMSLNCGHQWAYYSYLRQKMKVESHGGMVLTGEIRSTRRETCPSATLFNTNPTRTDPSAKANLGCESL
jgi:hypothetical protein